MKKGRQWLIGLAAGVALVIAVGAVEAYVLLTGALDPGVAGGLTVAAAVGGTFTLVDGAGRTVTDRTYRGRWELVYFGYTYCPDVCPTTLGAIADALGNLGPLAARVQPLFITIDPRRDTAPVIGAYVKNFDPRIVGLTGTPQAIAEVAKEFKVYYAVRKIGNGPDDYLMDHSSVIYVMDPQGRFARLLGADLPGDQMAAKLRQLVSAS